MRVALFVALLFLLGTLGFSFEHFEEDFGSQGEDAPPSGSAQKSVAKKSSQPAADSLKVKARLMKRLQGKVANLHPDPMNEYLSNADVEISTDILPAELRTPLTEVSPLATCGKPSAIRVRQEPFNADKAFDREILKAIIGKPAKYLRQETDAAHDSFTCVDSRHQSPTLGTPGGDFGEFLVSLSVMEELLKEKFSEDDVLRLLTQWVTWHRRGDTTFFHHTDEEAVQKLARRLHVNGLANVLTDVDIHNPPVDLREEMLLLLNQTSHQGSRVIRKFLEFPQKYEIRPELTSSMIRAFYRLLWDRDTIMDDETPLFTKMHLEVYMDKPHPKAWVSVRSGSSCEIAGSAHMVAPTSAIPKAFLTGEYKTMKVPADWEKSLPQRVLNDAISKELNIDSSIYEELGIHETHEDSFLELDEEEKPSIPMAPAEVFIHHPHAVRQLRKWLSRFFALRFPLSASQPKILQLIERKQQRVLEGVAESVGRNVPFYTVTIE